MCSKFNHTQCGCTCACAVACLCPHNSISNVVVSLTIHDNTKIFIGDVCNKHETNHCGRSCKPFVKLGFWWRKTNRTNRRLIPSAVFLRRAGAEQLLSSKANDWRNREHVCVCVVLRKLKWGRRPSRHSEGGQALSSSFSLLSSCLVSPLLSSPLSLSLSLSVCLRVMLRWCCIFCVCASVCLCVSVCVGRGGRGRDPVYVQKALRVSIQKRPVCTGTTRKCVSTCARGAATHRDVLNRDTEGVLYLHTGDHHTTHHTTTKQHTTQQNTTQHATSHRDRERQTEKEEDRRRKTREEKIKRREERREKEEERR